MTEKHRPSKENIFQTNKEQKILFTAAGATWVSGIIGSSKLELASLIISTASAVIPVLNEKLTIYKEERTRHKTLYERAKEPQIDTFHQPQIDPIV